MACLHLVDFFSFKTNVSAYRAILRTLVYPMSSKGFAKKNSLRCATCGDKELPSKLLACGHCIYFGCLDRKHIQSHVKHKHHHIMVCLCRGDLYCASCCDFKYYALSDMIQQQYRKAYLEQFGLYDSTWRPSWQELAVLPYVSVVPSTSIMMRGLVNMGNTCFLNVIVQTLTHTPVLRDFFLSDCHRCSNPKKSRSCIVCEMIRITQEVYKPNVQPMVPSNLLYLIWKQAAHLAGYEQRDAHEILIALLTLIHKELVANLGSGSNKSGDVTGSTSSSSHSSTCTSREATNGCECIVHQVFTGHLESMICYAECGHRSVTVDPFSDLSLDVAQVGLDSLDSCLRSYVRPENMDVLMCGQCGQGRLATKKFSLLRLPSVLCFHLKRCQHDLKINTKISFPRELDLAPYLSQVCGDTSGWEDRYSLYSVLSHTGQTNSGHYTCYIRSARNLWCLCDDQKIYPVTLDEVLQTDAYVLLYHKNTLACRTSSQKAAQEGIE